ncbi:MAG TPA: hypothetical protein VI076_08570 [Actinopolymorphaceae bacterium]
MHYCERCPEPELLRPVSDVEADCPGCGDRHAVRRLPLFVVTGASASGKTTVLPDLIAALPECVVFDVDWLIDPLGRLCLPDPMDWTGFRDTWLSVAHGVAAGGRTTVLLGPFVPEQMAELPARRWVTDIHFAVLDCSDEVRRARLAARPPWRERAVEEHVAFAARLRSEITPVVRTDEKSPAQVAARLAAWVRELLRASTADPVRW